MKRCIVVGGAPIQNPEYMKRQILEDDFIICADAGLKTLQKIDICPNLIIGDFDSYTDVLPENIETIKLPIDKDYTDMFCAVKEGISRKCDSFILFGGLGGRLDHTFANFGVLEFLAENNIPNQLIDEKNRAFISMAGDVFLREEYGNNISVFPFGEKSCTVSYQGLKYPLHNEKLYSNSARGVMGVSNSILDKQAKITIHEGMALIIISRD